MTIFYLDNQGGREGTSSVLMMNCEKKIRKKILIIINILLIMILINFQVQYLMKGQNKQN